MAKFSAASTKKLKTCDERLQLIMNELIKELDVIIICGHRNKEDQNKAYAMGKSKLKWPNGKHNKLPSLAVDVMPYPLDWDDIGRVKDMLKRVERIAKAHGIKLRYGRDFSFKDWNHIELV
jgi:peptidoglycan L-alanyl-D-glutamate endopeptidase CwlK